MSNVAVNRFEGRLFVNEGRLCMVVEADELSGVGRVSSRVDGKTTVVEMPVSEIGQRLSVAAKMTLDSIGSATSTQRIQQRADGWYFSAREGLKGPFGTSEEAEEALDSYILTSQSA